MTDLKSPSGMTELQHRALAVFVSSCMCLGSVLAQPRQASAEFGDLRTIFVDRYDYTFSTNHIHTIMENSANLGFTDVVFQIRGRGDAFYDSNYEPSARGMPTGFDPLQTAIDAAHSHGLRLHAWINSTNLWNTNALNPPASHMYYNANPSFRLYDINGNVEPRDGWSSYSSVNPILPEVHTHINNVVTDIATNYDVDGIHLDYIRYIPGNDFTTLPHDALSHQLFQQTYPGVDPTHPANAATYREYVKSRITDLVGSLKNTVDAVEINQGRKIDLLASVWRDPDIGENDYLQDYRTWLENDLLDIAMPMIYLRESNDNLFLPNLLNTLSIPTNAEIVPTLGVYLHDANNGGVDLTVTQLRRLYDNRADGAGMYDYPAVFTDSLAAERQTAITSFYDSIADGPDHGTVSPDATVLVDFELDEGTFNVPPTFSGSTTPGISAAADRTMVEQHLGRYSQEISIEDNGIGSWFVRHLSGRGDPANNVELETQGSLGFWLKTSDSGLQVAMVIDDPSTGERGLQKAILADGQWHLYEWDLSDDSQWQAWVTGNGQVTDPTTTMDSVQFFGSGDAVIYLDTIAHNPLGSILVPIMPGDYDGDGIIDENDFGEWSNTFGQTVTPGSGADGSGNGVVDAADFTIWRDSVGSSTAAAVPEPGAAVLLCVAACGGISIGSLPRLARKKSNQ